MGTSEHVEERPSLSRSTGLRAALRVRIELWLAVVFVTFAFGAGIVVRGLSETSTQPTVGVMPAGQMQIPAAPPLTDEQIQQGLPAGHPVVGDQSQGTGSGGRGEGERGDRTSEEAGVGDPSSGSP